MPATESPRPSAPPLAVSLPLADDREQARFVRGRLLVAGIFLGIPLFGFFFAPYSEAGPVVCASRALIGIPCPGCGLTRGVSSAARLDLIAATRFHPLAVPACLLFTAIGLTALVELAHGRRYPWYRRLLRGRYLLALLTVLLIVHGVRVYAWQRDGTLEHSFWRQGWIYRKLQSREETSPGEASDVNRPAHGGDSVGE